jgi:hypothetical protein
MGRGRVSTRLIFSHLWGRDRIGGLNRQRSGGKGQKICTIKLFHHRSSLVGHYLSSCSGRDPGVVIWIHSQLTSSPSWGRSTAGGSACHLSWRCYHLSFLKSKVIAKQMPTEWLSPKTDTKWRTDAMLFSWYLLYRGPKWGVHAF